MKDGHLMDPVRVVENLNKLTKCIENGSARVGFLFQGGYDHWLEDLCLEADKLKRICFKQLWGTEIE